MKLKDYQYLYNAAAYFAARERFGAKERAELDTLRMSAGEEMQQSAEFKEEEKQLQAKIDQKDFVAMLFTKSAEGFDALCWAIVELSTQAELQNRYMGRDPREMLHMERVRVELKPTQVAEARAMIMNAIVKGISPAENENAEVDEVLEQLQKKTGNP